MLISRAIPALYGGVSQQPDTQRSPIQLADMVNSWPTVVDGIGKRAPTEHVAMLSEESLEGAYLHMINRDLANRYIVTITDGAIEVYDLDGVRQGVDTPHGVNYLNVPDGASAGDTFACVTVADYTFVLNKSVAVQQAPLNSDRSAQPVNYFNVNRPPGAGGAQQWQYPPNPPLGGFAGTVQTFQDLPEAAAEGVTFKIQATAESGFSGYYVRRTQGAWIEVTRNGAINGIDAETMPWALVRLGDGSFQFAPFSWAPRRVGDETTNPGPSFLGRSLNDIFFANNRLGFACDENTIMSRAGDFGNFWRMSAIDLFDDDVVDVATTETKVTKIQHAVPMNGDLLLFSDQVQFRLDTGEFLTPTSCSISVITQYPTTQKVRPSPLGSDIYFAAEEGGWVRLFEYFVRDDSGNNDAADVTSHVPRFVPKGLRDITTSPEHDAVFLLTGAEGHKNRIYHYKFYWANENEKAQSAWGYWAISPTDSIVNIECMGEYMYLVIVRPDGTFLEKINLSQAASAPTLDFEVYLDRRITITGSWNSTSNRTTFLLPYPVSTTKRPGIQLIRGGGAPSGKGGLVDPSTYVWTDDYTFSVPGDISGYSHQLGRTYGQRWTFSKWFMEDSKGNPDLSGRLQIRTVTMYYTRAGYFKTEVAPYGGTPETEAIIPSKLAEFTGKTVGAADLIVGDPQFEDGSYSFQVYGNAADTTISIYNDSHLGAYFTSAEVEFFWQKRARFA